MFKRLAIAPAILFALAACGGGSSSTSMMRQITPPPPRGGWLEHGSAGARLRHRRH